MTPITKKIATAVNISLANFKALLVKKLYYEQQVAFSKTAQYSFNPVNSGVFARIPYLIATIHNIGEEGQVYGDEKSNISQAFQDGTLKFGFVSIIKNQRKYQIGLISLLYPQANSSQLQTRCFFRGRMLTTPVALTFDNKKALDLCQRQYKKYANRIKQFLTLVYQDRIKQNDISKYFQEFKPMQINLFIPGLSHFLYNLHDDVR